MYIDAYLCPWYRLFWLVNWLNWHEAKAIWKTSRSLTLLSADIDSRKYKYIVLLNNNNNNTERNSGTNWVQAWILRDLLCMRHIIRQNRISCALIALSCAITWLHSGYESSSGNTPRNRDPGRSALVPVLTLYPRARPAEPAVMI